MFPFQLAAVLFACGGEPAATPAPDVEPDVEPTEEPAPEADEMAPLEVELETNQMTCFGNADCVVVDLDCCCGQKVVAANKGSADAVAKQFKRPAEACASAECASEECAKPAVQCVEAKCALVE